MSHVTRYYNGQKSNKSIKTSWKTRMKKYKTLPDFSKSEFIIAMKIGICLICNNKRWIFLLTVALYISCCVICCSRNLPTAKRQVIDSKSSLLRCIGIEKEYLRFHNDNYILIYTLNYFVYYNLLRAKCTTTFFVLNLTGISIAVSNSQS